MKNLLISCGTGLVVLILLFGRNQLKESGHPVYESSHKSGLDTEGVKFRNSNQEMGIDFNQRTEERIKPRSIFENVALPPAVAVYDLNKDGFADIIFSGALAPVVFLNQRGKSFKRAPPGSFGFNVRTRQQKGMVILADINNDGQTDVFVQGWPDHRTYLGTKNTFKETSLIRDYRSKPDAVNFLDFNQDGRLDMIFGNFVSKPGEESSEPLWLSPSSFDNGTGGSNELLEQLPDGTFKVRWDISFVTRSYTHSAGIGDFNRDSYPDIFFANDYAHDELFYNDQGKTFIDKTRELIPIHKHGNSGMNGEVLDYNNDGLLDIYVTNIYKPPGVTTGNILWRQMPDGSFEILSHELGISKCGFSWAAKFADIENDGDLDLIVTNGRNRAVTMEKPSDGESLWYRRLMASRIPNIVRQFYFQKELPERPFHISAFEEHCLFQKRGDTYVDIAFEAGITDTFEGRGLAIADFNNDGLVDFVSAYINHPSILYMNHSQKKGNWLGVELFNKRGNNLPIGAKITVYLKNGTKFYREYYPANGYRAQSDWRLHFGLGDSTVDFVEVLWPVGKKERYLNLEINRYVKLRESP